MEYRSLYRDYRPRNFAEVLGQDAMVRTLKNAINDRKLSHAYLFTGTRGTGKTSTAKILAKAVNCPNVQDAEPCNECDICKGIDAGTIMDVTEIDAASNRGIDDVRGLREAVRYLPQTAKRRVFIIDEVHMLTTEAFNALLKTLEEPPEHALFLLATTEPNKVPATVLSRCQRFDLKRIDADTLSDRVRYICKDLNVTIDDDAVRMVVAAARGSFRDALTRLDQCMVMGGGHIDREIARAVMGDSDDSRLMDFAEGLLNNDAPGLLDIAEEAFRGGSSATQLLEQLMTGVKDMVLLQAGRTDVVLFMDEEGERRFKTAAGKISADRLLYVMEVLMKAQQDIRLSGDERIALEAALIKCVRPSYETTLSALSARVEELENELKTLKNGGLIPQKPPKNQNKTEEKPPKIDTSAPLDKGKNLQAAEPFGVAMNEAAPAPDMTPVDFWPKAEAEIRSQSRVLWLGLRSRGLKGTRMEGNTVFFTTGSDPEAARNLLADEKSQPILKKALAAVTGIAAADMKLSLDEGHKSAESLAKSLFPGAEIIVKQG